MSIEAQLRKADKHAKSGQMGEAVAGYAHVLARFPGNKKAKAGLAAIDPAAVAFNSPARMIAEVDVAMLDNNLGLAEEKAKALTNEHPNLPQGHLALSRILQALEKFNRAADSLGRGAAIVGGDPKLHLAHANALIQAERYQDAVQVAAKVRQSHPDQLDAPVIEARALSLLEQNEGALTLLDSHIAAHPSHFNGQMARGNVLSAMGQAEAALVAFEAALKVDPKAPGALNNIASALTQLERFDEALGAIDKALELAPGHKHMLENRARTLAAAEAADAP